MQTLLSDAFSYGNGALSSVSGGVYAKPSSWANECKEDTSLCAGTAAGENADYVADWAARGGSAVAQWGALTLSTAADFMGPTVFNDGVGSFYFLDARGGGAWQLYRVVAGAFTGLNSMGNSGYTTGTVVRLEVNIVAGSPVLESFKDTVSGGTFTDSAGAKLVTGVPGLRLWDTTARASVYEAGDFGTAGSSSIVPIVQRHYRMRRG